MNIGFILLGLWLILYGVHALMPVPHPMGMGLGVLAIVTGILVLVAR